MLGSCKQQQSSEAQVQNTASLAIKAMGAMLHIVVGRPIN